MIEALRSELQRKLVHRKYTTMKPISFFMFLIPAALSLAAFYYNSQEPPYVPVGDPSGRIMAFRELTLLENTKPEELERFAREQLTPTFKKHVPGVESYIIKGQRGDNKGKYVHLLVFDSETTRNFYFPYEHSGETNIPEAALKLWQPGQVMLLDSLPKYAEPLGESKGYTDYVFLE